MRQLLILLALAIYIFAILDCARSDEDERYGLPKTFWMIVVIFLPGLGAVAWIVGSRVARFNTELERRAKAQAAQRPSTGHPSTRPARPSGPTAGQFQVRRSSSRTVAPDDDPEFLAELAKRTRKGLPDDGADGSAGTGTGGAPQDGPTAG